MMRRFLIYILLAVVQARPSSAGQSKNFISARSVAATNAVFQGNPSAPSGWSAPGAALGLLPRSTNLGLNASVVAAIANPVPATAMGMPALYFTVQPAVAAAAAQPAGVEAVSAAIFDGQQRLAQTQFSDPTPAVAAPAVVAPQSSTAYLRQVRGLSGAPLLRALHDIAARNHTVKEYNEAKREMFSTIDQVVVDGKHGVIDAYSQTFVPGTSGHGPDYKENGDQNHDGTADAMGMNAEHLWPRSLFGRDRLPMVSDLHNLMTTFSSVNEKRGSRPFGIVRGETTYRNAAGMKIGDEIAEPPDAIKGEIARRLLGFYTHYYDRDIARGPAGAAFWNENRVKLLLNWNRRFPPTARERLRNDLVGSSQGSRNPFVDDPSLADRITAAVLAARRR